MKKNLSKILLVFSVICLSILSIGGIFFHATKTESAKAAEPPLVQKTLFDYLTLSTNQYVYSVNDVKDGKLYINNNVTVRIKETIEDPLVNIYVKYDGVRLNLTTLESYAVISYESGAAPKTLELTNIGYKLSIIPTKVNFKQINPLTWWTDGDETKTINTPTFNSVYKQLTFKPIEDIASVDSPIYIKVNYNGQIFEFQYNSDNKIYLPNATVATSLTSLNLTSPGPYTIEIYDGTHFTNDNYTAKNHLSYSFFIVPDTSYITQTNFENGTSTFYYTLTTSTGQYLANGSYRATSDPTSLITTHEYTNYSVTLKLTNLKSYRNWFSRIAITKTIDDNNQGHQNITTYYNLADLETNNFTIQLEDHANYRIEFQNYTDQYGYKAIECYTTQVYIFKDILSGDQTFDDIVYKATALNEIVSAPITKLVKNQYKFSEGVIIQGTHTSEATLKLVNAQSSLSGVENNETVTGTASLKINGVGTIKVETTHNGSTSTEYVYNGQTITFTSSGDYFVKITDEMGNVLTRSFKITAQMNIATLILIIIAAIVLLALLLFIIITRKRVKVR